MVNKISVRQICIILFAYGAVTKLLIYPVQLASQCGNALLFPILFDLLLQTVIIWAVAYLSSRTDKTFYGLLEGSIGKTAARIIFFLFALFFILNALVPMIEQQLFVHKIFYDTIPSLITFLPFFVFAIYAGAKSFTNAGRSADICLPIFIAVLVCIFVMSFEECNSEAFLPILKQPFGKVAGSALSGSFRFTESAFLLMFLGHYKYKKGDAAKITLSYVAGGVIVLAFAGIYYAVYGNLATTQSFAISSISLFFPAIDYVGRIDLIAMYALEIVLLFALVLNIQASSYCLGKAFGKELNELYSVIINAVLIAFVFIFNYRSNALLTAAGKWFWIAALAFAYIAPLSAWVMRRRQ